MKQVGVNHSSCQCFWKSVVHKLRKQVISANTDGLRDAASRLLHCTQWQN